MHIGTRVTRAGLPPSTQGAAERRARWGGDAIPEGFIRFSAGCEDTEDLLADLTQALDTLTRRPV